MAKESAKEESAECMSQEGAKVLKNLVGVKKVTEKPVKDSTPGYHSSWGTGTPAYISSAVKAAERKAK